MEKIITPITPTSPTSSAEEIANLQAALAALGYDAKGDSNGQYGISTIIAVAQFQKDHGLFIQGDPGVLVDQDTADKINELLGLSTPTEDTSAKHFIVSGRIRQTDGKAFAGATVRAFEKNNDATIRLGEDKTDEEGRYAIRYELIPGLAAVNLLVAVLNETGKTLRESKVISGAKPLEIVNLEVSNEEADLYQVKGKIDSQISTGVGGLRILIVDKGIGGDLQLAQVTSNQDGAYQANFLGSAARERGKSQPDLQVRVFSGDVFLGASEVLYNAAQQVTLDVLLDDQVAPKLASEHQVLTDALVGHYNGELRDLKETDEQQDIGFLANKTGWDARAVALAALADQFSAQTADATGRPTIPQTCFYALFRAGLPANEDTLYHTDAGTLERVWTTAAEQGVIDPISADQIPKLAERFRALSAEKLLSGPALIGSSTLRDMLKVSLLEDTQQETFAQLYAMHRTDMSAFWQAADRAFGERVTRRLQVDGKIAFLTINNAPLMRKIHETVDANELTDPIQLAQAGYHSAEAWQKLLTEEVPIPKEVSGDTVEARRLNYANYLAAKVELSYPTAAIAQLVKSRALTLPGATNGAADDVHTFLTNHQGKFEIGMQPVQEYISRNNLQAAESTVHHLKQLQRVYQITPGNLALTGMMKHGLDAAAHVVRYDKDKFVERFGADLGGTEDAILTYDKSVQVHNAVLNIAISYLTARNAPAIGVHSPPNVLNPVPANTGDVIAYSTLESLFGSMDYCTCEHCRSILSPAAYLVDLLLFLDQPGEDPSPQEVLLERRPDIQHLPLTCENTNTVLPYIDVVNETLEYYIANESPKLSLKGYPGHDTNGISSEDLLASPQFVRESAYLALSNERFPMELPLHQPLENLRRYFNKFEVPLPQAMERLRRTDDLERGANNPYGWRDILMEEIGLSRAEYEILTDSKAKAVPLWRMYGFPDETPDAEVFAGLSNVKLYARRLGISYEDLIAIVKTQFVNPNAWLIPKLERLGVNFATLNALKVKDDTITDGDFDALVQSNLIPPNPKDYDGDIKNWIKNGDNYARIMGLITLLVPTSEWAASKTYVIGDCVRPIATLTEATLYFECTQEGTSSSVEPQWPTAPGTIISNDGTVKWICRDIAMTESFDNLAFRYSNPDRMMENLEPADFIRLLRFVRLWKKLGWTIEQTDAAICALFRTDFGQLEMSDVNDPTRLDRGFLTLLPRLGILNKVMQELNLTVKRDLLSLLACWSDIGTYGNDSLYRQMFLQPAILAQDDIFADNGYGEFLVDKAQKLLPHVEALRSAFNLSGDEFDRVFEALRFDENTELTIPNISAIYRHGWLARKMKISIRELLLLIRCTRLDPFAAPDPTKPAILRLINMVQALKDGPLKTTAALYLIWNQDLSGKSAPTFQQMAAFARSLRTGFAAVEAGFDVKDDPEGAIAQARMGMVYESDTAAFFFGLLNDTHTANVMFSDPEEIWLKKDVRLGIEEAAGKTDEGVPKIAYDDFRKQLAYSGELTGPARDAIKSVAGTGATEFNQAVDELYEISQKAVNTFFARYPELRTPFDDYKANTAPAAEKRFLLLKAIMPELIQREKRQQALQAVSTQADIDPAFTQIILDASSAPFPLHAISRADQPSLNDFLALETPGLTAQFYANDKATGTRIPAPAIASKLDYAANGNPLPKNPTDGKPISGVWSGYLEAPVNGFYKLQIEADAGATIRLSLDGKRVNLAPNGTVWSNANPIEMRAGMLYLFDLKVEKVAQVLRVQWEWAPKGQGRAVIPARYLYSATSFSAFQEAYIRFLKTASLATGLGLSANEMAYFAAHSDCFIRGRGWLNALPVSGNANAEISAGLLKSLEILLDFARIKADVSQGSESLLSVLQDPKTATQQQDSLLFSITRWNPGALDDMLERFNIKKITDLAKFDVLRRVYDAFALVQKMGISANALIQATTNEPSGNTVRDLQAALRARYDVADWRAVIRPINDEMRSLQRNALVAYILHQMRSHPASAHIDTPEKLFEYFLMDVQMDPCMQTSRIRHALSSVQLFIERCIMNLEPRVSPVSINAKQWAWMKRYRVWEANRKVYLYPENWLEPELRDDKSPFFKELESELLQSDITNDSATAALLNYLQKLEEVAKLEPCGFYRIPAHAPNTGEVNHVVARTSGAQRKYFYRRYEYGYWTPWEQIRLDIEDNPVIPVVWNGRLLLFWLKIIRQMPETSTKTTGTTPLSEFKPANIPDPQPMPVKAILCWSEYYNGKWQPTKTSDVNNPALIGKYPINGDKVFNRDNLRLTVSISASSITIDIHPRQPFVWAYFELYNTNNAMTIPVNTRELVNEKMPIMKTMNQTINKTPEQFMIENIIGIFPSGKNLIFQDLGDKWGTPFFFADSINTFYVTTKPSPVLMFDHDGHGMMTNMDRFDQIIHIPALILHPEKIAIRDMLFNDNGIDPGRTIKQYAANDINITKIFGIARSINFGGHQIGLSGRINNLQIKK
ncbi:MAG: neuraminidase-like domain-containing protein [Saprospiraceae bacterium]